MKYSILITSYECHGQGHVLLKENLDRIIQQTYRPIECIVSDHSKDDIIESMIQSLDLNGIELKYLRYKEHYGNPCHNWNNALNHTTGDLIHYLAMDDMLLDSTSVERTVDFMKRTCKDWAAFSHVIHSSNTVFIPKWNRHILYGINTISGPSAIVIKKNIKHIRLNPDFKWYLDLEWYYRLFNVAGEPSICTTPTWIMRDHALQLTNTVIDESLVKSENEKLRQLYGNPLPYTDNKIRFK